MENYKFKSGDRVTYTDTSFFYESLEKDTVYIIEKVTTFGNTQKLSLDDYSTNSYSAKAFTLAQAYDSVEEIPDHDPVNYPSHYRQGNIECIEVIEDWDLGFHLGNAVKYIMRSKHKNNYLEDLKKARWYLDRHIASIQDTEE